MRIQPPKPDVHDEAPRGLQDSYEEVERYLNVKAWKCRRCGLTNFGRNEKCADINCREARDG